MSGTILEAAPQTQADLRDLLRNRGYVALWTGQLVSWAGNSFHRISLFFLLMSETSAGSRYTPLLMLLLIHTMAYLLFSPLAGVFVDRWDRKRTMMVTDLIRAGLVLCIPLVEGRSALYTLTFLVTAVSLVFEPARSSALPNLVKPPQLFMANSFMSTSESIAETFGFFAGGLVVASFGYRFAFYFDAITFLISALCISFIQMPPTATRGERPVNISGSVTQVLQDLKQGIRYSAAKAEIGAVFILFFLMALSLGSSNYLLPFFADSQMGGPAAYGAIAGALTLGYLIGSVLVGVLGSRSNKVAMLGTGLVGMGLGLVWIASSPNLPVAVVGAFVGGLANPVYYVASRTYLQEMASDEIRGRVFSLQFLVVQVGFCASVAIAMLLLDRLSVSAVLLIFGLALSLTGALGTRCGTLGRMRGTVSNTPRAESPGE